MNMFKKFAVNVNNRNAVNASEHDSVIFTGQGCTGAVHKLVNALKPTLEHFG